MRYRSIIIAALFGIAPLMGGCNYLQANGMEALNKVAMYGKAAGEAVLDGGAKSADLYCGLTPTEVKTWFRDGINERTKKYEVELVCKPKA